MANILYGVSGEGFGHSSRATEITRFLLAEGHTVKLASYDKGYQALAPHFDVVRIPGLSIHTKNNKVAKWTTMTDGFGSAKQLLANLPQLKQTLFNDFHPDLVLCDFEPITAYLAKHYDLPLISIDNQHRMRYLKFNCPAKYKADALLTTSIIKLFVPKPDLALITTFHAGEVKNAKARVFPPILREQIAKLQPKSGKHVLVYMTQQFNGLLDVLQQLPREQFIVYGAGKEGIEGHIEYRAPSQEGFLEDLRTAKSVIATAGFTLLTESLYLHKPYLAFPMQGQFEQVLNALELERSGYGAAGWKVDVPTVAAFLYRLPDYRAALQGYARSAHSEEIKALLRDVLALTPLNKAQLQSFAVSSSCHKEAG